MTELNEALKELEEEMNLKKEEELAELRQRFGFLLVAFHFDMPCLRAQAR